MGKVVRAIGVVAAIAVNVIPGAGQALSGALFAALGTGFVSAGLAAAVTFGITAGITAIGVSSLNALRGGGRSRLPATGITGQVGLNADTPQWIAVGRTATPSALVYWGTSGTDNKYLSQIIAHSFHPVNALVGLKINTQTEVLTGNSSVYTGNAEDGTPILTIENVTGSQTTTPFTTVRGGQWGAAHIGRGLAMTHLRWAYDQEKLATGLPQNVQAVVEGVKVYDPRRDSTRGGSGTHRADDETTWAYKVGDEEIGRNPALIELSYRIGFRQNGRVKAGMGEDLANLDFASYIAAANVCDELVGGAPRYQCDAILFIGPGEAHNINLAKIHASCGGKQIDSGGLIGFWAAHDDTATVAMAFTDDDFVGAIDWNPLPGDGLRNTARGSFIAPAKNYVAEPYLEVAPSDLRTLDNGQELSDPIDFPSVTREAQARQLASVRLRESRQGILVAPMRLKAMGVKPQAIVTVTHPRYQWTAKKFRVEQMDFSIDQVRLTLRAVAAADYADVTTTPAADQTAPATDGFYPIVPVRGSDIGVEDGATVGENLQINALMEAGTAGYALNGNFARVAAAVGWPVAHVLQNSVTAMGVGGATILPRVPVIGGRKLWFGLTAERSAALGGLTAVLNQFDAAGSGIGPVGSPVSIVPAALNTRQFFQIEGTTAGNARFVELWLQSLSGATVGTVRVGGFRLAASQQGADVTAEFAPLLVIPVDQGIQADSSGTPLVGQLPRSLKASLFIGTTDVSSSTTWTLKTATGGTLSTSIAEISSSGLITLKAAPPGGLLIINAVRGAVNLTDTTLVTTFVAAPEGGSGGGTSQNFSTFTSSASTTFVEAAAEKTVRTGSAGTLTSSAPLGFTAVLGDGEFGDLEAKWQHRTPPASGTWVDFGTAIADSTQAYGGDYSVAEPEPSYPGFISINQTKTGLTADTDYGVRLVFRSPSADTSQLFGTGTVSGS